MPPSSTHVIDDDDTSSSAIFKLDSDQFTHSGGGDDDASSDSTLATTPKSPHKRRKLATSTWQLACDPLPHEAIRDGKNRIWYCSMWACGDGCGTRGFGGLGRILRAANTYYTTPRITNLTIVVREQSRESSYFEALPKLGGVRSLLSIKIPCKDCTIQYSISISIRPHTNIEY
jgi:hypothetical protein